MDLSNMTVVEGDTGVIVIDPLLTAETGAAGLGLYRKHRGDRPVTGVIYTHSHADHFGGVRGVVDQADVDAGRVPVLAPAGFLEHAVAENVYAGTAMNRRAAYMYGAALARGVHGQVGAGLGQTISTGDGRRSSRRPRRSPRPARKRSSTVSGWSSRWRRAPRPRPRCTSTSPTTRRSAWPRTPPTTCTTC